MFYIVKLSISLKELCVIKRPYRGVKYFESKGKAQKFINRYELCPCEILEIK